MREFIIVGAPNCGKTLFTLNFAAFLGSKGIDVLYRSYDGLITCKHFSLEDARRELCSAMQHKTKCLQSLVLKLPFGKTAVNFKLTDTCGLTSEIHSDKEIRRGMAQTLNFLRSADFVFHIVDLSLAGGDMIKSSNNIDMEIYNYGTVRANYVLLANKFDLQSARANIGKISVVYPNANIIPISALHSQGFKEVKAYVARNV